MFTQITHMQSKTGLLALIVVALFWLPLSADAGTVVRTGESVTVAQDQTVEDDFYAAGNTVSMSGTVRGDMYAAGGTVTINGDIQSDLTVIGGAAQVHATVADDVRVLGGEVVIAESVGGDVFVIGGLLKVLSSAEIAGDVYFFGGEAEIDGAVNGSVLGTAEIVRVNGPVAAGIDITAYSSLTLGERANVSGDVQYVSNNEIVRAQNAVVTGEVSQEIRAQAPAQADYQALLTPVFMTLFAALLAYLFFRRNIPIVVDTALTEYGKNGLIGFAILFGSPMVIVLTLASVLGVVVGLFLFMILLALYLAGLVLMGIVLGFLLQKVLLKTTDVNLVTVISGTVLVYGFLFVPIIGPLLLLVLFAVTIGALVSALYRAL